jgi:hypothetical protein
MATQKAKTRIRAAVILLVWLPAHNSRLPAAELDPASAIMREEGVIDVAATTRFFDFRGPAPRIQAEELIGRGIAG